jgi:hypothetical protein
VYTGRLVEEEVVETFWGVVAVREGSSRGRVSVLVSCRCETLSLASLVLDIDLPYWWLYLATLGESGAFLWCRLPARH